MGYHQSGLIVTDTVDLTSPTFTEGEELIQFLYTQLTSVGWTATKIMAHVRLWVPFGIVAGDKVVVGGFTFTFITQPDEPFGVTIQGTTLATLENLGNHTRDDIDWVDFETGVGTIGILNNVPFIEWTVPDYPDPPEANFEGNLEIMEIIPNGALGFFDFTIGGAGHGRTWGGGFVFTSLPHALGGVISFKIQTINTGDFDVIIQSADEIGVFRGLDVARLWRIIANPHQFLLFAPGVFLARTFLLVSSLYPYGGATQANFIAGPMILAPGGANRLSLAGVSGAYYVNMGSPYYFEGGIPAQVPNLVFPGWGIGISVIEKLSNKIDGLDIKRDNSKAIPFEAFIAACVTEPDVGPIGSDKIHIIGSLWDAFITTVTATIDSIESVNGLPTWVVLYQAGDNDTSKGALLVQLAL